jgi:hypothetical protein
MSNSPDYIITTISSSVEQYGATAQAPFRLGPMGSLSVRLACRPYFASENENLYVRENCIPAPPSLQYYTHNLIAENPNGTTPAHVGSIYLPSGVYSEFGAVFTDVHGGVGGETVYLELRRFTNGATLLTLTNSSTSGGNFQSVVQNNLNVAVTDWYDIYIYAAGSPATTSAKGIYYKV